MADQLSKWKTTLAEKEQYKVQLENALNTTISEILQLKGGIQYAESLVQEEETEPSCEVSNEEATEEEAQ
tara:strand:- start:225 stop:434 length:210 start_codon:yes stop_codon:yes gene_type:complete